VKRAVVAALLAGCAPSAKAVRLDAQLAIACDVPEARIYVDDMFRARAGELLGHVLAVPSGVRRIEVRADGWFTAYRDVVVAHAGRAAVEVALRRVPETEPSE
jgi:hypothetical protein